MKLLTRQDFPIILSWGTSTNDIDPRNLLAVNIVLIPGLWLDGSSWDEIVPAIERAGHRTR